MSVLRLEPSLQHYAWGDRVFIPELLGLPPSDEPCAEAWFGAHPLAPATVGGVPLDQILRTHSAEVLGPEVHRRFGGLPYLLKLLSAARPLSIQCHPDRAQAAAGFAREEALGIPRDAPERSFRDPNHKPEMIVALTPFVALCGFRPLDEIASMLSGLPELHEVLPPFQPTAQGLRSFVGSYFALDEGVRTRTLVRLMTRLEADSRAADERDPVYWASLAHRELSSSSPTAPDPGLLFVFLLALVKLDPGQALCLSAGVLHAYLRGSGVELMASSDNVLRAGLTPKHVNAKALMDVVRFDADAPTMTDPRERVFAAEFVLSELNLPTAPDQGDASTAMGPETLLVLPGPESCCVTVHSAGEKVELRAGQACLVSHGTRYELSAQGSARVYRVGVPSSDRVFRSAVLHNIGVTEAILQRGEGPALLAAVSGSEQARRHWQNRLGAARASLGAHTALSLHEDLPVNQGFGLLLAWKRLREHCPSGEGALAAFVFGDGTRATPFTEAEAGQKPAIASFVRVANHFGSIAEGTAWRAVPLAELALRYFVPVERHLRRSGFDGVVFKWGDEIQIPTVDLAASDPRFRDADIVRFVSMRAVTERDAQSKDWVGVDHDGRVVAFIPRRPLAQMRVLVDRGLMLETQQGGLWGGINLGSIGVSRLLLDALLEEFDRDLSDRTADRGHRPDLDPQLFTALTIAANPEPELRGRLWARARHEVPAIESIAHGMPGLLGRLRAALDRFEATHGRPIRMVAMDFGGQYWGDVGQHDRMREFMASLRDPGPLGDIARALAGVDHLALDARGNLITADSRLGPDVEITDSVVIGGEVRSGRIERSVLVGSNCRRLHALEAFDLYSTASDLRLEPRSGAYKVVTGEPMIAREGERIASVFMPNALELMRCSEETDLRDREKHYDRAILDNRISFAQAHDAVTRADPERLEADRTAARAAVIASWS